MFILNIVALGCGRVNLMVNLPLWTVSTDLIFTWKHDAERSTVLFLVPGCSTRYNNSVQEWFTTTPLLTNLTNLCVHFVPLCI